MAAAAQPVPPVATYMAQRREAAIYLHQKYHTNYTYSMNLVRIAIFVMGILTLKGKVSPMVGITSLAVAHGATSLVGGVVSQIHRLCSASKLEEMTKVVDRKHPHVLERWAYFKERVKGMSAQVSDLDKNAEADQSVAEEQAKDKKNKSLWNTVAVLLPALGLVAASIITAMALNNYWSVAQLKIAAGYTLLSCAVAGICSSYAYFKTVQNPHYEFIITHYVEGGDLMLRAQASENAAAIAVASRPTEIGLSTTESRR